MTATSRVKRNRLENGQRRRAQCPNCGRTQVWIGDVFTAHRRSDPHKKNSMLTPTACAGEGIPIEAKHLRGQVPG